jgi:hypothetical protein
MRTLLLTVFSILLGASIAAAGMEASQMFLYSHLSSSLSGTTSAGFDFVEIPKSAIYGFIGAGFLVISVLRRRRHIYRIQKHRG